MSEIDHIILVVMHKAGNVLYSSKELLWSENSCWYLKKRIIVLFIMLIFSSTFFMFYKS